MKVIGILTMFILYCSICETQHSLAHTSDAFSKDVERFLHDLVNEIDGVNNVVNDARAKFAAREFSDWDSDRKLAGMIVYLFTSPCNITNGLTDTLNRRLNQALVKSTCTPSEIWNRFADVLSAALDVFGNKTYAEVFRGETSEYPSTLSEQECSKRFYSTTLDPDETRTFGGQYGIFYHIHNVVGTDIHELSTLSEENEVLIKPGTCFMKVYSTRDVSEISREMANIKIGHGHFPAEIFIPEQFIVLKPTHAINDTGTSGSLCGHDCSSLRGILIFVSTFRVIVKGL